MQSAIKRMRALQQDPWHGFKMVEQGITSSMRKSVGMAT
jgi:hypothetical protein